MKLTTVALALLCMACNANKDLVAKATGYAMYYQDQYVRECVVVVGPDSCKPCQEAINDASDKKMPDGTIRPGIVTTANKVYKSGYLPEAEKRQLKELIARLEEECP